MLKGLSSCPQTSRHSAWLRFCYHRCVGTAASHHRRTMVVLPRSTRCTTVSTFLSSTAFMNLSNYTHGQFESGLAVQRTKYMPLSFDFTTRFQESAGGTTQRKWSIIYGFSLGQPGLRDAGLPPAMSRTPYHIFPTLLPPCTVE